MTLTTIPRDTYTYIHTYYYWIPACNNTIDSDVIDHDATRVSLDLTKGPLRSSVLLSLFVMPYRYIHPKQKHPLESKMAPQDIADKTDISTRRGSVCGWYTSMLGK